MKKKYSLRGLLIIILLLFVVAILGFIYLFQTTFLDSFYIHNKINTLYSTSRDIANNIGENNFDNVIDKVGMSNEVCIRVVSNNEKYNYVGACALRNLDNMTINMIARDVIDNDNEKMFDDISYKRPFDAALENVYIYAKMIKYNNEDIMIMVSSAITPLSVTISTLKSQYLFIAGIVIAMTVLLALLISTFIVGPIKKINLESMNLSKGSYDGNNIKTSSQEFDQLNMTLVRANEDILKADKARKELLGNISHDLRTPLTMIVGYGEMIRDLPDENSLDNINIIIDEAKRLSTLVDDLLDISKLEDNNLTLQLQKISLNELLTNVYHQYDKYCKAQNIDLRLNLLEDIIINVDEKRIKQVLYNFINNSLNYCDNNQQQITLGVEKIEDFYRVYVEDNGQGIDSKDLENIWERYYKVDKEHKRHHIGSGIGLSLSKEIILAHNLNFGVDSQLSKYSKFYFDVRTD